MTNKILTAASACFLLAACGQKATVNQNSSKTRTTANAVNQNAATPVNSAVTENSTATDKSKIKTFNAQGTVTKINAELGSIALDHEEIKGLMPAMEGMEFYVSDKKLLDGLKIGDKVDFVLEDNAGAERIVGIKKN